MCCILRNPLGVDVVKIALPLPEIQYAEDLTSDKVICSYGIVSARKYSLTSAVKDITTIKEGDTGFVSNFAYHVSLHRCWERESDGLVSAVAF